MNQPLVSAIVPVYDGELYLHLALKSIHQQNYVPLEVIIIDDGSNDRSADIARQYKEFHYIFQSNQGVAKARNVGIQASSGEFIAFLDQDDEWTPNKIRLQTDYLMEHPQVGYVLCNEKLFLEPGIQHPSWLKKELLQRDHPGYVPSALMVRKKIFEEVGLFDPNYVMGSDSDWFARAKDAGILMEVLPETLIRRRIHNSNCSYQLKLALQELRRVVKTSIDRQRKRKSENVSS